MNAALITGGTGEIGKAIAMQLGKDSGFHLIINYSNNEERAQKVLEELKREDLSAELLKFNIQNAEETEATLNNYIEKNPSINIQVLVNNAGIVKDNLMLFMEKSEWSSVINLKTQGFFNVTKILLKPMLLQKYGRIVNIASLIGVRGAAGQANYAAANAAIIAATKSLSQEVARKNITVNAVAPGFIRSEMTKGLQEDEIKKIIPAGRLGEPEEIAHLVSFLASEKASYINGETITISGGLH